MHERHHRVTDETRTAWQLQLAEVSRRSILLLEAKRKLREIESLVIPPVITSRPPYLQSSAPPESTLIKNTDIN